MKVDWCGVYAYGFYSSFASVPWVDCGAKRLCGRRHFFLHKLTERKFVISPASVPVPNDFERMMYTSAAIAVLYSYVGTCMTVCEHDSVHANVHCVCVHSSFAACSADKLLCPHSPFILFISFIALNCSHVRCSHVLL